MRGAACGAPRRRLVLRSSARAGGCAIAVLEAATSRGAWLCSAASTLAASRRRAGAATGVAARRRRRRSARGGRWRRARPAAACAVGAGRRRRRRPRSRWGPTWRRRPRARSAHAAADVGDLLHLELGGRGWPPLSGAGLAGSRGRAARLRRRPRRAPRGPRARLVVLALGEVELVARDVGVEEDVGDVEERGLLVADVDEGRLHAREHPGHATLVDVADDALVFFTLEVELGDVTVFHQRDAGLAARGVDDEDAAHG